uniref:Uncharacterized protein n=1 Tax=Caenorhabditis tropicalis TaxID=1561998 RepID=A0A1I7T6X3_9PELO
MSRALVFLFFVIAFVATVTMAGSRKSTDVYQSCGVPLIRRVQKVCGQNCYGDGVDSLPVLACSTGVSDEQLTYLCCPQ